MPPMIKVAEGMIDVILYYSPILMYTQRPEITGRKGFFLNDRFNIRT